MNQFPGLTVTASLKHKNVCGVYKKIVGVK